MQSSLVASNAEKVQPRHESASSISLPSSSHSASANLNMSSTTFVDRIDPFAKRSLKKKSKKSQGSSRYRNSQDVELQQLPQLKG